MVACIRGLDDIAKYRRFRLLRPLQSVHHNAREWWLYAARCHGYRRVSAERRFEIAHENRRYMEIYSKIIVNPNENLPNELKELKDKVEKERTYEELEILREVMMTHINVLIQIQINQLLCLALLDANAITGRCNAGGQPRTKYAGPMVPTVVGLVQNRFASHAVRLIGLSAVIIGNLARSNHSQRPKPT